MRWPININTLQFEFTAILFVETGVTSDVFLSRLFMKFYGYILNFVLVFYETEPNMGGVRWCKNCHTSHKRPIGSKCQQFEEADLQVATDSQASTGQVSGSTVTLKQARLVADHVTVVKHSSTVTSTGTSSSQDLILGELQKISQIFSKLGEQTLQDRTILSDLVNYVHSNQLVPVTQHIVSTSTWSSTSHAGSIVMTSMNSQSNSHSITNQGPSINTQLINSVNSALLVSSGVNNTSMAQNMGARSKTFNTTLPNVILQNYGQSPFPTFCFVFSSSCWSTRRYTTGVDWCGNIPEGTASEFHRRCHTITTTTETGQ